MQAQVEGLIDFRTADPYDPDWWTRYNLIIRAMRRRNDSELHGNAYKFHLALLGNGRLTKESFERTQTAAQESFWDLVGTIRPWEGENYAARKNKEFDNHRQAYIDNFGVDPTDPRFKEWEAAQIAKLKDRPPVVELTEEEALMARLAAKRKQQKARK